MGTHIKHGYHNKIRNALRRVWQYYPEKDKAFERAKRLPEGGSRYWYECAMCLKLFPRRKDMDVDHIEPVGPMPGSRNAPPHLTWHEPMEKLFAPAEGYQVLCKKCHKDKSRNERKRPK